MGIDLGVTWVRVQDRPIVYNACSASYRCAMKQAFGDFVVGSVTQELWPGPLRHFANFSKNSFPTEWRLTSLPLAARAFPDREPRSAAIFIRAHRTRPSCVSDFRNERSGKPGRAPLRAHRNSWTPAAQVSLRVSCWRESFRSGVPLRPPHAFANRRCRLW